MNLFAENEQPHIFKIKPALRVFSLKFPLQMSEIETCVNKNTDIVRYSSKNKTAKGQ